MRSETRTHPRSGPAGTTVRFPDGSSDVRLNDIFITAGEAYPAFEEACLDAESRIVAGFRVFDPATTLRSDRTRALGETWAELLAHMLGKGVDVTLVLSDFDAIARPELHRLAHATARALRAIAGGDAPARGRLRVVLSDHPARMGLLPRLLLYPVMRRELGRQVDRLNAQSRAERAAVLADSPGIRRYFRSEPGGAVALKPFTVPEVLPATHHQKLAVIDGAALYIGGLDLNERRFDTPEHDRPADETWHDVQVMVTGPVALEAERHLLTLQAETTGNAAPELTPRLLRTLSARRRLPFPFFGPKPRRDDLAAAHRRFADRSERLIYIETQFFRDLAIARHLAERGRRARGLNLVLILPAAPEDYAFGADDSRAVRQGQGQGLQMRCLRVVQQAFEDRLFVGSPAQCCVAPAETPREALLHGAPIIYVHSKVAMFDDTAAIVSSANLNGRSLQWDTEAGVALTEMRDVNRLRDRCMAHWLGSAYAENPAEFHCAHGWSERAKRNAAHQPAAREGFVLPFPWKKTDRVGSVVPGLPDEAF